MFFNCGVGEDSWESLGLQGDPTSPSWRKSVLNIHWKDWCWSWNSNNLATLCEELIHWKRPDAGKDWRWRGGEGDNRGCDGWMASLTQWAWVWVNSVSWWWTGRPGMLQSMGLQRVRHRWAIELNCPYLVPLAVITDKAIYLKIWRIVSKKITSQDEIPREAWPRVLPLSIIFPTIYLLIELLWWKTECLLPWEVVRRLAGVWW